MSWTTEWTDGISEMVRLFVEEVVFKGTDPELSLDVAVSIVLIGMGGLLTTLSLAIFGVLTVGALYGLLTES
jgi:actin-like ATPase involved in cell morphogenesis